MRDQGVAAIGSSGVLGEPPAATLSEEKRLLDALVDDLTRLITATLEKGN